MTQTRPKQDFGAESAGSEKSPPAGAIPAGGACFSAHFLLLSDTCHEAADFLRGFFFHARRDVRVDIQRKLRRGVTEDLRDRFRVNAALDCQRRECVPLRYNYDKPEKPRISRVFGYLARFFILFQTEKSSREVIIS